MTILKEDMPNLFQEAYNHSDPVLRERWRDAIKKEVRNMINGGVFHQMKQRDVPNNRRCVKHKWVFDIKRLRRFRAPLVACAYSQIPGVDFQN